MARDKPKVRDDVSKRIQSVINYLETGNDDALGKFKQN
jgi:hypothetical protein